RPEREVGVHAVVIPDEPVVAPHANDISQVIAAAIGADLGSQRRKEEVLSEYQEDSPPRHRPFQRDGWKFSPFRPPARQPDGNCNYDSTGPLEYSFPRSMREAEERGQESETARSGEELD